MHTRPTDLVNVWRSASDRPNVLAVLPHDSPYTKLLDPLRDNDDCEVVLVESFDDAVRLLRRGNIAVVVLDGAPTQSGSVELILEGLSKDRVPRFFVLTPAAPPPEHHWIRTIDAQLDSGAFRKLVMAAAQDFEARTDSGGVTALELLEAAAQFPDDVWLRICNESGEFGDLCVRGGKAIYCEADRQTGDQAAAAILTWHSCLFEFRALPDFLNKNMDRPLSEIRGITRRGAAATPTETARPPAPPVVHVTPPVKQQPPSPEDPPELEEPIDFPSLGQFATPADASVEEPLGLPDFTAPIPAESAAAVEEPLDEPCFDMLTSDTDFDVEEPPEMLLEEDAPLSVGMASPPSPDFHFPSPALPETESRIVTQSLFAAIAVIGDGELETCLPPSEQSVFAPATLRDIYDRSRLYSLSHKLGSLHWVLVGAAAAPIVVAGVPGSDRLVAARLRSPYFSEKEEAELKTLISNLPVNASAASV